MKIKTKLAKSISYGNKRSLKSIKYIIIHYTGNSNDTAQANANYFATSNKRQAGAHFFVDKLGNVYKSVNMNRIAWAVGGLYTKNKGAGKYYGQCTNTNSVSIELCDCTKNTSWTQMLTTRELVKYIQKKCPNAKTIIRHWDVNGKECPAPMIGANNDKWEKFHTFITKGYPFQAKVTQKAAIRSSGKVTATNKIDTAEIGKIVNIEKMVGNWGRLKKKDSKGRYRWITLSKLKEV